MLHILLREVVTGCPLYFLLGKDPRLDVVSYSLVFTILLVVTDKFGLLKRRTRLDVLTECSVVFMGALAFRDVLVLLPAIMGQS